MRLYHAYYRVLYYSSQFIDLRILQLGASVLVKLHNLEHIYKIQ